MGGSWQMPPRLPIHDVEDRSLVDAELPRHRLHGLASMVPVAHGQHLLVGQLGLRVVLPSDEQAGAFVNGRWGGEEGKTGRAKAGVAAVLRVGRVGAERVMQSCRMERLVFIAGRNEQRRRME